MSFEIEWHETGIRHKDCVLNCGFITEDRINKQAWCSSCGASVVFPPEK